MYFSSRIQLLLLLVLLSRAFVSSASLPTLSDVHRYDPDRSITHWAVKIDSKSSSFGSYVFGTMDTDQLADAIATELGLVNGGRIEPFKDIYKFVLPSTAGDQTSNYNGHNHDEVVRSVEYQVRHFDKQLNEHSSLLWSAKQVPLKRTKRTLAPERDLRRVTPVIKFNDPKYRLQWHLVNDKELGNDVNVTGIWHHNITGGGVVIAVVDDGKIISKVFPFEPKHTYMYLHVHDQYCYLIVITLCMILKYRHVSLLSSGLEHTNIDIADNYVSGNC